MFGDVQMRAPGGFVLGWFVLASACGGAAAERRVVAVPEPVQTEDAPTEWTSIRLPHLWNPDEFEVETFVEGARMCLSGGGARACIGERESVELASVWLDDGMQFAGCAGSDCLWVDRSRGVVDRTEGFLGAPTRVGDAVAGPIGVLSPDSAMPTVVGSNGRAWVLDGGTLRRLPLEGVSRATFFDREFGAASVGREQRWVETHDGGRTFAPRAGVDGTVRFLWRTEEGIFAAIHSADCQVDRIIQRDPLEGRGRPRANDPCAWGGGLLVPPTGPPRPFDQQDLPDLELPLDKQVASAIARDALLDRLGFGTDFVLPATGTGNDPTADALASALVERAGTPIGSLEAYERPRVVSRGGFYFGVGTTGPANLFDAQGHVVVGAALQDTDLEFGRIVVDASGSGFLVAAEVLVDEEEWHARLYRADETRELSLSRDVFEASALALVGDELLVGGANCPAEICAGAFLVAITLDDTLTKRTLALAPGAHLDTTDLVPLRSVEGSHAGMNDFVTRDGTFHALFETEGSMQLVIGPVEGPLEVLHVPDGILAVAFMDARRGLARTALSDAVLATDDGGRTFRPLASDVGRLTRSHAHADAALARRRLVASDAFSPWLDRTRILRDDLVASHDREEVMQDVELACSEDACLIEDFLFLPDGARAHVAGFESAALPSPPAVTVETMPLAAGLPWRGYVVPPNTDFLEATTRWMDPNAARPASFAGWAAPNGRLEVLRDRAHPRRARIHVEGVDASGARFEFSTQELALDPKVTSFGHVRAVSRTSALVEAYEGMHGELRVITRDGGIATARDPEMPERILAADALPSGELLLLGGSRTQIRLARVDVRGRVRSGDRIDFPNAFGVVLAHRADTAFAAQIDPESGAIALRGETGEERLAVRWDDVRPCLTPPSESTLELKGPIPLGHDASWWPREPVPMIRSVSMAVVDGRACLRSWSNGDASGFRTSFVDVHFAAPDAEGIVGYRVARGGIVSLRAVAEPPLPVARDERTNIARMGVHDGEVWLGITTTGRMEGTHRALSLDRTLSGEPAMRWFPFGGSTLPHYEQARRLADGTFVDRTEQHRSGSAEACVERRVRRAIVERLPSPTRTLTKLESASDAMTLEIGDRRVVIPNIDSVQDVATLTSGTGDAVAIVHHRAQWEEHSAGRPAGARTSLLTIRADGSFDEAFVDDMGPTSYSVGGLEIAASAQGPIVAVFDAQSASVHLLRARRRSLIDAAPTIALPGALDAPILAVRADPLRVAYVDAPIGSTRIAIRVVELRDGRWVELAAPHPIPMDPHSSFAPAGVFDGDTLYATVPRGYDGYAVLKLGATGWETVLEGTLEGNADTPMLPLCDGRSAPDVAPAP